MKFKYKNLIRLNIEFLWFETVYENNKHPFSMVYLHIYIIFNKENNTIMILYTQMSILNTKYTTYLCNQ